MTSGKYCEMSIKTEFPNKIKSVDTSTAHVNLDGPDKGFASYYSVLEYDGTDGLRHKLGSGADTFAGQTPEGAIDGMREAYQNRIDQPGYDGKITSVSDSCPATTKTKPLTLKPGP